MAYSNDDRGKTFIGVSVVSLIHDGKGRFLLQKRGPKARDERGNWDLCAGAVEFGQTIEETIGRELGEELLTAPLDIIFISAGEAHREYDGQQTHWIWLLHAVRVDPTTVRIGEPDKISDIGWFTTDVLPKPLHSQLAPSLEKARLAGIIR